VRTKLAGLPVWAWLAIVGGLGVGYFVLRRPSGASASANDTLSNDSATTPGSPGDTGDSSGATPPTGISDADLAALLGPDSPLQQILTQLYGGGGSGTSTATASGAPGDTTTPGSPGQSGGVTHPGDIQPSIGTALSTQTTNPNQPGAPVVQQPSPTGAPTQPGRQLVG
jgi:hypothetical protein